MNHHSLHITRLLLTLFTALSLHASAGTLGSLTYEIVNGTSVTITDCDEAATGAIVIPETIESLPVTSVDGRAFEGCSQITSISYPSQIQYPPYHYIGCNSLEAFHVAESNTAITSIDGVLFSADMTKIIRYPNARSTTTDYAIPDGVTSFYPYTFLECTGLNSVTIPASLSADTGSESVQQVILSVFKDTSNLQAVHVEEGNLALSSSNGVVFTQDGSGLLFYPPAKPSTSYTVPTGTTYISFLAFNVCPIVESIHFPETVTSIADNAFIRCNNLAEFNIHPDNTTFKSIDGVIFSSDLSELIIFPQGKTGTYSTPTTITRIRSRGFSHCTKVTDITLPEDLQIIGASAFENCTNLTKAYLLGNAPSFFGASPFPTNPTIHYLKGATGFDVAPWTDYNLVEIDTSTYPNAAWLLENQQDHTLSLDEDPNGDGVPLLMEYALGLKAYQNNAPNLPQMEIGETTAGITFQGDTPGINYEVWTSTDLSNWTQTGVTLSTPDANGKRSATIPHSTSPKAFLQLRVSQ
ncbi:hypothetical protein Rhal01_00674 [Rubritalea halochordaticola]|uniref:Leucine-rich repeat domain-containing protein n=1 Tax=Rubritalea halochordaticola TaxID=714537 RepID=A0ABP9V1L0_9BACT